MTEIQKVLQAKFAHVHPLIFHRSLEKATSDGDLFDILDTLPELPVVWDEKSRRWQHTDDLLQSHGFQS